MDMDQTSLPDTSPMSQPEKNNGVDDRRLAYRVRSENARAAEMMFRELSDAVQMCLAQGGNCQSIRRCYGATCRDLSIASLLARTRSPGSAVYPGYQVAVNLQT